MSRWRPEAAALGLDAGALAGAGDAVASPVVAAGWDRAALATALRPLRADHGAARVLVCADLCKHFVHRAPAGVQSLAELRQLASLRAAQLFGGGPDSWAVVADWQLAAPFACAALPQALLQDLQAAAQQAGLRLQVESALLVALERVLRAGGRDGFVAWTSPRHAVLAGTDGGAVHSLRCSHRAVGQDGAALAAQLQRDSLRASLVDDEGGRGALALAWPGPGQPPALPESVSWFDAAQALPLVRPQETEAAWAQRLALLE